MGQGERIAPWQQRGNGGTNLPPSDVHQNVKQGDEILVGRAALAP